LANDSSNSTQDSVTHYQLVTISLPDITPFHTAFFYASVRYFSTKLLSSASYTNMPNCEA